MNHAKIPADRPLLLDTDRVVARPVAAFTLGDVFAAIRRSPFLVIVLTGLGGAGGFAGAKMMPVTYEATAQLISDAGRSGFITLSDTDARATAEDSATATIVETIGAPVALGHALDLLPPDMRAELAATIEPPAPASDPAPDLATTARGVLARLRGIVAPPSDTAPEAAPQTAPETAAVAPKAAPNTAPKTAPNTAPAPAAIDPALERALLIRHLSHNLEVSNSGRSYVVNIRYTSKNPDLSAAVANAVANGYLRLRSDLRLNVYRRMLANLETEIEELTNNLEQAERRAQSTRERGRLMQMRFETLTGQKQDEAIEASANVYAQQRKAEREVEATAAVYERLLLEHRQVQSRIGAPELTVQLFAPAVVPLSPAGFNAKPVILALGLMAGFLLGSSLAILRQAWRRRRVARRA